MRFPILIEIDIWSDPVWPTDPGLAALKLPTEYEGKDVSRYRLKVTLEAVEVFVSEDPEVLEWVNL